MLNESTLSFSFSNEIRSPINDFEKKWNEMNIHSVGSLRCVPRKEERNNHNQQQLQQQQFLRVDCSKIANLINDFNCLKRTNPYSLSLSKWLACSAAASRFIFILFFCIFTTNSLHLISTFASSLSERQLKRHLCFGVHKLIVLLSITHKIPHFLSSPNEWMNNIILFIWVWTFSLYFFSCLWLQICSNEIVLCTLEHAHAHTSYF